ncbi:MAG TPA: xanthine dehydrogenase small subunit [Bacteroidia bacterium]|jgi:xanthine dehydrogenase small subunit|nr:xanthine dehydrogenase small subunit [Bacteroidia bacterium]
MQESISFVLDGKIKTLSFDEQNSPTTTLLNYLRQSPCHKGVKEGCAEGDCGACTVVLAELGEKDKLKYRALDSCLVFLPMIQGKQVITVENLSQKKQGQEDVLHPVQDAMVNCNGSQCGYCTPGIVMSLFALYKSEDGGDKENIQDALTGNLCRCTGYKPIIEAAAKSCAKPDKDQFSISEKETIALLKQIRSEEKSIAIQTDSQSYYQPNNKTEALALRKQWPDSVILSGATDIGLRVTKKHELLERIIDLSHVPELKEMTETDAAYRFGAGLNLEDLRVFTTGKLTALHEALAVFGSRQIRSLATLGGNLGSGSPIGDTLPVLMAYDAEIVLESTSGQRKVNMNQFILGYRQTARRPDELITAVIIPKPVSQSRVKFYKVSKRKDLDISTVSAGFQLQLENKKVKSITLAYGGMAAVTKRASEAESFLTGKEWKRDVVEQAMDLVEKAYTPLSDARSGAAFRSLAAKNLLLKFWIETGV